jgi:phosphoglycerate-specific signal transduction histidine kinase
MLGATVMDRISSHVNNSNIVTVDNGRKSNWDVELLKHLLWPTTLSHDVGAGVILSLGVGMGDICLEFGWLVHQFVTQSRHSDPKWNR